LPADDDLPRAVGVPPIICASRFRQRRRSRARRRLLGIREAAGRSLSSQRPPGSKNRLAPRVDHRFLAQGALCAASWTRQMSASRRTPVGAIPALVRAGEPRGPDAVRSSSRPAARARIHVPPAWTAVGDMPIGTWSTPRIGGIDTGEPHIRREDLPLQRGENSVRAGRGAQLQRRSAPNRAVVVRPVRPPRRNSRPSPCSGRAATRSGPTVALERAPTFETSFARRHGVVRREQHERRRAAPHEARSASRQTALAPCRRPTSCAIPSSKRV